MRPSDTRSTLSTRPGFKGAGDSSSVIGKGHDGTLRRLQDARADIKIYMISGRVYEGKVLNRDRWTITIHTVKDKAVTLYKHAIEGFVPQEGV